VTRPLDDADLRAAIRDGYGFDLLGLEVESDGVDAAAWAWRASTTDGRRLFVKLRREVRPAAMLVPRHLAATGFQEVVAAMSTTSGAAWLEVDGWTAVVMDLVDGPTAFRSGLSLDGWRRLGALAARVHAVRLPPELLALVPVDDLQPKATTLARGIDDRVDGLADEALDEDGRAVRARWIAERPRIRRLVERTEELGVRIRAHDDAAAIRAGFVLCHGDLHAANILVDADGEIHVVDWDEVVLAPRERDLMFVRGSVVAGVVTDAEADAFEAGYGQVAIDRELLAWYRLDWAVQDVAGFAAEVLFEPERVPATRPRARRLFEAQFEPGDQAAIAPADEAHRPTA